jgi:tellurite methyltransferase
MESKELTAYDRHYADSGYYWGTAPSKICDEVVRLVHPDSDPPPSLIDLGCGEGRNVVHFARLGFRVTGVDVSIVGLEQLQRYAEESGVAVRTVHADIGKYELDATYDVVFSTGAVHYLPPRTRRERFEHLKEHTAPGGVNAHSALVGKPFLEEAPDADPGTVLFRSGELMSYYWDWEIVYCVEEVFDCRSAGVLHKHAVNRVVARRYGG